MRYIPYEYHILLFNTIGEKVKIKKSNTLTKALCKAEKFRNKHPTCSTVITHVLHNSQEITDKWGMKNNTG